jgi:hypothetical protein
MIRRLFALRTIVCTFVTNKIESYDWNGDLESNEMGLDSNCFHFSCVFLPAMITMPRANCVQLNTPYFQSVPVQSRLHCVTLPMRVEEPRPVEIVQPCLLIHPDQDHSFPPPTLPPAGVVIA